MRKKTINLSVKQYATEYREPPITPRAVQKAIKEKHKLPGVVKVERVGNQYVLEVEEKK